MGKNDARTLCDNCHKDNECFRILVKGKSYWFCKQCLEFPGVLKYRDAALHEKTKKEKKGEKARNAKGTQLSYKPPSSFDNLRLTKRYVESLTAGDFGRDPLGLFDAAH